MDVLIVMIVFCGLMGITGYLSITAAEKIFRRPEARGDFKRGMEVEKARQMRFQGWVLIAMAVMGLIVVLTTEVENGEVKRSAYQECLRECRDGCKGVEDGGKDRGI